MVRNEEEKGIQHSGRDFNIEKTLNDSILGALFGTDYSNKPTNPS